MISGFCLPSTPTSSPQACCTTCNVSNSLDISSQGFKSVKCEAQLVTEPNLNVVSALREAQQRLTTSMSTCRMTGEAHAQHMLASAGILRSRHGESPASAGRYTGLGPLIWLLAVGIHICLSQGRDVGQVCQHHICASLGQHNAHHPCSMAACKTTEASSQLRLKAYLAKLRSCACPGQRIAHHPCSKGSGSIVKVAAQMQPSVDLTEVQPTATPGQRSVTTLQQAAVQAAIAIASFSTGESDVESLVQGAGKHSAPLVLTLRHCHSDFAADHETDM